MVHIMANGKKYVYFLYSRTQYQDRCNIESSIGIQYIAGRVIKNGHWANYTEMSNAPTSAKYPDSKIIASGYLTDMKYEIESRERRKK